MMMSVVSAFGRETREAIAVASVSRMMLINASAQRREVGGRASKLGDDMMTGDRRNKKGNAMKAMDDKRESQVAHPLSMVSSNARSTTSRFSRRARFSTWLRRSMETASLKAFNAACYTQGLGLGRQHNDSERTWSMSSFSDAAPVI
jgi:hypothetical protein